MRLDVVNNNPVPHKVSIWVPVKGVRQISAEEASGGATASLESGAWFYRGYTQMDDQQHVLSALLAALPVLEAMEEVG